MVPPSETSSGWLAARASWATSPPAPETEATTRRRKSGSSTAIPSTDRCFPYQAGECGDLPLMALRCVNLRGLAHLRAQRQLPTGLP